MIERRVVDNRTLVIGLDDLYRKSMAELEVDRLLGCARTVARTLGVSAASVPVEGYYASDPALTEYFLLMRALQALDASAGDRVSGLPAFTLLRDIATSGLYGHTEPGRLLPQGRDPLHRALEASAPQDWTVARLVTLAHAEAIASDEFSLVALAARTADPIVIAATRESVALYGAIYLGDEEPRIEYIWQVNDDLARLANRFIHTFNQFGGPLPAAEPAFAADYYSAAADADLMGRCVLIGTGPRSPRYYHWAIAGQSSEDIRVEEFWDDDHWTTERYVAKGSIKNGW